MKKQLFLLLLWFLSLASGAQELKWHNPMKAGFPVLQNQGFTEEIGQSYSRLPDRAKSVVRDAVWNLSRNSAGLALHFYCNAPQIKIRYKVNGSLNMPHMPTTGVSGIDMYSINSDRQWNFCFGNYSFGDTIHYKYSNLGKDKYHNRGFEYRIYLPLYNSVEWMEIGIPETSELTFIPQSPERPVVLYGTSIAQGACASRPAIAWGNIVQRTLGFPLINLGFSGNGRLEKEVTELVVVAVKQLRDKHSAPILLIEHAGYINAPTDARQLECYTRLNKGSRLVREPCSIFS